MPGRKPPERGVHEPAANPVAPGVGQQVYRANLADLLRVGVGVPTLGVADEANQVPVVFGDKHAAGCPVYLS